MWQASSLRCNFSARMIFFYIVSFSVDIDTWFRKIITIVVAPFCVERDFRSSLFARSVDSLHLRRGRGAARQIVLQPKSRRIGKSHIDTPVLTRKFAVT